MLSRIAESLFWIGRYVERADDTARILDVHVQVLFEDPWAQEETACRSLLSVMGATPPARVVDRRRLLELLAYDAENPSAIAGSLAAARENARRARETVSSDMWEALNTTWNALPEARRRSRTAHAFLSWVRERAAVVAGIADATMSRDDGWHFLVLGRSLERADMSARLVASSAVAGGTGPSWTHLLRSCGAYESFLRTYHGAAGEEYAAEFLLLDRLFPRSVFTALSAAEACLAELAPAAGRVGVVDEARRALGQVRTGLEFRRVEELLADLPDEMERIQLACSAASDAVSRRYFPRAPATTWLVEVS